MDYKKILDYLYGLESPKIKLGLERTQKLLDKVGNPEKKVKFLHVAGTNGKGSVCAMLQSALVENSYKVGMYTSPHLKRFNERIRVNDKLISDREIVDLFLKVKPYVTNQSFFEITTAMAFLYFAEKKVDYAIVEVGLGGRLDATNVITSIISVITNISLEHTEFLGKTVGKIAFEKAGIIKPNVPVVTGAKGDALKIIKKIASEKKSPIYASKRYADISFKFLNGKFQQSNKDIVFIAIDILSKSGKILLNKEKTIKGLEKTKWPGRMQFISNNVLIDGAHNAGGFKILEKELKIIRRQRKIKNFIFVFGAQRSKDIKSMLSTIEPFISKIIFTKSNNEKAANPKDLAVILKKIKPGVQRIIIKNPRKALTYARKIVEKNDLVVATGSLYMLGDII